MRFFLLLVLSFRCLPFFSDFVPHLYCITLLPLHYQPMLTSDSDSPFHCFVCFLKVFLMFSMSCNCAVPFFLPLYVFLFVLLPRTIVFTLPLFSSFVLSLSRGGVLRSVKHEIIFLFFLILLVAYLI